MKRGRTREEQSDRDYWTAPEGWGGAVESKKFELYPDNLSIAELFLDVQTQWTVSAAGERTGLNYTGVEAAARLLKFDLTPENFAGLQLMERTLIRVLKDA